MTLEVKIRLDLSPGRHFTTPSMSRGIGQILVWACLTLIPLPAFGQEGAEEPELVPLARLLVDADGDFVPDGLGERFRVRGHANMEPRRARTDDDGFAWYFTTIEDGTGAIRLLTLDEASFSGIHVGTVVEASGILTHRRGSEELILDRIEVTSITASVQPLDALVRETLGEGLMHRLVRLEGIPRDLNPAEEYFILEDRSGAVEVRVTNRFLSDPETLDVIAEGKLIAVVGVVGQADRTPPFDSGYRVSPRDPQDLSRIRTPPYLQIALVLLFLSLGGGMLSFAVQRKKAVERARRLEALTQDLERSKQAHQKSAEEYRALFEDDAVARFVLDAEGKLQRWNGALEGFLGRGAEELQGARLSDLVSLVRVQGVSGPRVGTSAQSEIRVVTSSGQAHFGIMSFVRTGEGAEEETRGAILDISRRKELEAQFLRTQKMEAVGRLAGGVAHGVNNMLSVILGNAELLQDGDFPEGMVGRELDEIREAAIRSSHLMKQLLIMARRDVAQPEPLCLNTVVRELAPMLQRMIGVDVELTTSLDEEIPEVWADLSQMEQVFLNLVVNAREAMPRGGKLEIETLRSPGPDGDREGVRIRVTDTGKGMDSHTAARVFEPFFTTKDFGSGLGLSSVYGVITGAGGTVTCTSTPGEGSMFELWLPSVVFSEMSSPEVAGMATAEE